MTNNELQFTFAIVPESKKNVVYYRQVFWLVRFSEPSHSVTGTVVFESETLNGLTAAGTAPVLHRIPFSLPIPDVE
jgi:hypothetical protein